MVVFNFRLKSKAAAAAAAAFVAVLTAVICAFCAANVQTTVEAAPTINDGNFAEERAVGEYLDSLGYTDRALVSCDSVKIPREFDGVYGDYNALQEKNGFDLSKYKGKTVRRYTYSLGGTNSEFAVVLAKNGEVIGGHLTDGEYGGDDAPLDKNGKTGKISQRAQRHEPQGSAKKYQKRRGYGEFGGLPRGRLQDRSRHRRRRSARTGCLR